VDARRAWGEKRPDGQRFLEEARGETRSEREPGQGRKRRQDGRLMVTMMKDDEGGTGWLVGRQAGRLGAWNGGLELRRLGRLTTRAEEEEGVARTGAIRSMPPLLLPRSVRTIVFLGQGSLREP
jgi:hypothetical protein